jgi:stage V sporulation protein AE
LSKISLVEIFLKFLIVFAVGGAICTIGQMLILWTNLTTARILTAFVAVGVILGAAGAFEPMRKVVGAGITVPIVGFGGVLAGGAIKAVEKDGFFGILTGGLAAAAGALAVAIVAAFLVSLVARSRSK